MLFHVTIRHEAEHCPGYDEDLVPEAIASLENLHRVAESFGVKVHGLYNALPDHIEFLICESDSPAALAMYLTRALPYRRVDTDTRAVVGIDDLLAAARQRALA